MLITPQDSWYISRSGQTYGPYTWAQIVEHARGGRIGKRDQIFDPRTTLWTEPSKVPGLFGPAGAAGVSLGLSAAAKTAIVVVISLVILAAGVTTFGFESSHGWWHESHDPVAGVNEFVGGSDTNPSQTAEVPPEGLAYKGTFHWESAEGPGAQNLVHDDPCYLWIYTTDDGTAASFDFGIVDGWPVYLVSQTGSQYVFESSLRSKVERVRIVVDVADTRMSGNVTNINNVGAFLSGTFSGDAITYQQYKAEVD